MPSISDFVWASFISSANERASSARFSQYSTSRNSDGGVGTAQLRVLLSSSLRSFWFEINKRTKDDPVSKHIAVQKACRFRARDFPDGTFFLIARNRSREFVTKFAQCTIVLAHYQFRQRIKSKRMQATAPMRAVTPTNLDISCKRRFISITFLRMPSKTCFSSSGIIVIPVCVG